MDCCIVRALLLLVSCSVIFACPQHHHGHHSEPPRKNTIEITNSRKLDSLLDDDDDLKPSKGNEVVEEVIPQLNIDVVLEDSPAHVPSNFSLTNESHTHSEDEKHHVECVCALFSVRSPIETDAPLMSKTFYNVSCDGHADGRDACTEVCITFAMAHYDDKDDIICSHVHNATGVTGYLHSKHCNGTNPWTFTGIDTLKPVCCKNDKPVGCEEGSSTTTIEY